MSLNIKIQSKDGKSLNDIVKHDGVNCLPVITQEYKEYLSRYIYLESPTHGIDMAQDFSSIESTENVHDGNDNTYWTASIITGNPNAFDFSSTVQAHSGTQSIEITGNASDSDIFQLANDTVISNTTYNRLSGWVYVEQNWSSVDEVEIYFYNTGTGEVVSGVVNLSNYINYQNSGEWQKFSIPLSEFGSLNDYDAIRWELVVNSGDNPEFFLDDIVLEDATSDSSQFILTPPRNVWWHVIGLGITIVAPYSSTLTDGTLRNIPYNGILGTSLVNGLNYQRHEEGEVIYSLVIRDLIDMLAEHDSRITDSGYDGNNTWVKLSSRMDVPVILKPEREDFISLSVSDDLSSLVRFRIMASIREEKRILGVYDDNHR